MSKSGNRELRRSIASIRRAKTQATWASSLNPMEPRQRAAAQKVLGLFFVLEKRLWEVLEMREETPQRRLGLKRRAA